MHVVNGNAVRGRLYENYLTQTFIAQNILHTKYSWLIYLSAVQAQTDHFKVYQQQVVKNARTLAAALSSKGYGIVSGGTDTHVVLLDLRAKVYYNEKLIIIY